MDDIDSLELIGLKFGTDKSSINHDFLKIYEKFLFNKKNDNLNFLEIGIFEGKSIKMWNEYLVNSKIHAADIENHKELDTNRIITYKINQEKIEELITLPKNLDVILDDGGHSMLQQQLTFKILFKDHLKNDGIYILEDLHTSKQEYWYPAEWGGNAKNNTLQLLNDLKNKTLTIDNEYFITQDEFNGLLNQINSLEIFENKYHSVTSVIIKK
jgi:hypothetical protein